MPYPNEHAARIHDPDKYDKIRRENNKFKSGIHAIWGIKDGKTELQAVRFDASKYTVAQAKKWLKDNNIKYILFEPASGKKTTEEEIKNNREMEQREIKYRQGQVRGFLEDRTVEFVISDESKDRHNSIIPSTAWDLRGFEENPIAGWAHSVYGGRDWNPDNFIGRWENIRLDGGQLVGGLTFEDEETNPLAEKLYRKVRNGTINAVSVGFIPNGGHYGEEDEARGGKNETYYYDSAELIEVSLVGIPSNKNARKKAFENGDIPELINDLIDEALGDKLNKDEIEKLTLKGLFTILRGGDAPEVEEAETGQKVDLEAREKRMKQIEAMNNYLKLVKDYDTKREIRAEGEVA